MHLILHIESELQYFYAQKWEIPRDPAVKKSKNIYFLFLIYTQALKEYLKNKFNVKIELQDQKSNKR